MPAPKRWSLQDAKNKLSEVVDAAARRGPQVVTRRGVETAVVLSYPDYVRVAAVFETPRVSFESFLQAIPRVPTGDDDIERIPIVPRDVDL
jgi:antitoxin Phd